MQQQPSQQMWTMQQQPQQPQQQQQGSAVNEQQQQQSSSLPSPASSPSSLQLAQSGASFTGTTFTFNPTSYQQMPMNMQQQEPQQQQQQQQQPQQQQQQQAPQAFAMFTAGNGNMQSFAPNSFNFGSAPSNGMNLPMGMNGNGGNGNGMNAPMQHIQQAFLAKQQYDLLQQQSQQLQLQAQQLLQQQMGNGNWMPVQQQPQQSQQQAQAIPMQQAMFNTNFTMQQQPQQGQQMMQPQPMFAVPTPYFSPAPMAFATPLQPFSTPNLMAPLKTLMPLSSMQMPSLVMQQPQHAMPKSKFTGRMSASAVPLESEDSATALTALGASPRHAPKLVSSASVPSSRAAQSPSSSPTVTVAKSLSQLMAAVEGSLKQEPAVGQGREGQSRDASCCSRSQSSHSHRRGSYVSKRKDRSDSEEEEEEAAAAYAPQPQRRSQPQKSRKVTHSHSSSISVSSGSNSVRKSLQRQEDEENPDEEGQAGEEDEEQQTPSEPESAAASDDDDAPFPSSSSSRGAPSASLLKRSELACGSIRTAPGTKTHKFRSVIRCGVTDRHGNVQNNMMQPYFGREMDVYTAESDTKKRPLVRASTLADKFNCATNKIGMYLARRRTVFNGIYQATEFANKPAGKTGLKIGGYFLTLDACADFERHYWEHRGKKESQSAASAHRMPPHAPTVMHVAGPSKPKRKQSKEQQRGKQQLEEEEDEEEEQQQQQEAESEQPQEEEPADGDATEGDASDAEQPGAVPAVAPKRRSAGVPQPQQSNTELHLVASLASHTGGDEAEEEAEATAETDSPAALPSRTNGDSSTRRAVAIKTEVSLQPSATGHSSTHTSPVALVSSGLPSSLSYTSLRGGNGANVAAAGPLAPLQHTSDLPLPSSKMIAVRTTSHTMPALSFFRAQQQQQQLQQQQPQPSAATSTLSMPPQRSLLATPAIANLSGC